MKRFLVSVLVAVCLVGTVAGSLGATFTDTAGTKYEAPAALLSSLNLITGYPGGTFRPADTLTRAQFSTIAVRILGLESAAEKGPTPFKDVPATHWASGYINVAYEKHLVQGYGGGLFKPEQTMTFAEALTVLVRMLGYQPALGSGTWPTPYLVKAAELGLTRGVTFGSSAPATRGDISIILYNALTVKLMVMVTAGENPTYAVSDKTLLEDWLGLTALTGVVTDAGTVFGTGLEANQIEIDGHVHKLNEAAGFEPGWIGYEVQAWRNANDEIMVIVPAESDVVAGAITDIGAEAATVKIGTKTYTAGADIPIFRNNEKIDPAGIGAHDADYVDAYGQLVMKDGKYVSLVVKKFDGSLVLTDIQPKFYLVKGYDQTAAAQSFDLDGSYDDYVVMKDGQDVTLDQLAVGDVAGYFEAGGGSFIWLEITSSRASGTLETVSSGGGAVILTIDGEDYELAGDATMSLDGNKTFLTVAGETELAPLLDKNVTAYLDSVGAVRHIASIGAVAEKVVGVVKSEFFYAGSPDPDEPDRYFVRVLRSDGSVAKLEFDDNTLFDGADEVTGDVDNGPDPLDAAYPAGTLVAYTIGHGGLLATFDKMVPDHTISFTDTVDIDTVHDTVSGSRVSAGTAFFDIGQWRVRSWSIFKTMNCTTDPIPNVRLYDSGDLTLEYLVYSSTGETITYASTTPQYGVVTGRILSTEGVKVKILVGGAEKSYLATSETTVHALVGSNHGGASGDVADLDAGDFVTFEVSGTDYVTLTEPLAEDPFGDTSYEGYVDNLDTAALTLTLVDDPEAPAATTPYILDLGCLFFDVSGEPAKITAGAIVPGSLVQIIDLTGDGYIDAVKVLE